MRNPVSKTEKKKRIVGSLQTKCKYVDARYIYIMYVETLHGEVTAQHIDR